MEILTNPVKGLLDILNPFSENFFLKSLFSWLNPVSEDFILKNLLDWLNPFSENFILKQLWDFLTNIVSYINPFSDNFLGKKIVELIGDLLNHLFVPINNPFSNLSNKFEEKFSFVNQIKDLMSDLLGFNDYGDKVPSFKINYKNMSLVIVDFSVFLNYRFWLHSIILAISWFIFIRKTYNKIPSIIGGFK